MLPYKKVLVTGGAGFIGSHLCDRLVDDGVEVICLDSLQAGKMENIEHLIKKPNFEFVHMDIATDYRLSPVSLETFIKTGKFDVIFHQAASKKTVCLKDPQRDLEVNGLGTLRLLQYAKEYGVRKFVHASTGSVYGRAKEFPQTENTPLNPCSYYGVSKLAGERYVQLYHDLYGLDTTILRYFHVYGKRQDCSEYGGVVAIFEDKMRKGEPITIFGTGEQERSFTYVDDVVTANVLSSFITSSRGKVYNVSSGIIVTLNQMIAKMETYFGSVKKEYKDWVVGDIEKFDVDNTKIMGDLGIRFRSFGRGLSEMYADLSI